MINVLKQVILVFVVFCLNQDVKAQADNIIYDLPEMVTTKAKQYVESYIARNGPTKFIAELDKNVDGKYLLFVIINDFEKQDSLNIFYKAVIRKTNRRVRLGDSLLLPLITSEDLQFAYLGDTPPRKPGGRKGRKKVVFTHESYSITFDSSGKIYE